MVAEVAVDRSTGEIAVERVTGAIDAGDVVNPDGLRNQTEGGIVQASSWTLYEEVKLGKDVTFSTVRAVSGRGTVPQVFIGGKHIGGADDVEAYFNKQQKKAA